MEVSFCQCVPRSGCSSKMLWVLGPLHKGGGALHSLGLTCVSDLVGD